jgi:hypothetical protein
MFQNQIKRRTSYSAILSYLLTASIRVCCAIEQSIHTCSKFPKLVAALMVYISILEQQSKFGDALEILSGKLGSLLMIKVDKLRMQVISIAFFLSCYSSSIFEFCLLFIMNYEYNCPSN